MPDFRPAGPRVTRIEPDGFWLRIDGRELFVPFARFPRFQVASGPEICRVTSPRAGELRWPALDVDLTVDSIEHPDRFPLTVRSDGAPKSRPDVSYETRAGLGATFPRGRRRPDDGAMLR